MVMSFHRRAFSHAGSDELLVIYHAKRAHTDRFHLYDNDGPDWRYMARRAQAPYRHHATRDDG